MRKRSRPRASAGGADLEDAPVASIRVEGDGQRIDDVRAAVTVAPDPAAAGEDRGGRRERDVALPEREVAGLELLEDLAEDHLEVARSGPGGAGREVTRIGT